MPANLKKAVERARRAPTTPQEALEALPAPRLCMAQMEFAWYVRLQLSDPITKGFLTIPCILAPGHDGDHRHTFTWTNPASRAAQARVAEAKHGIQGPPIQNEK